MTTDPVDETPGTGLWKLGQVVEDRWGLRWRADIASRRSDGWQCRSVGLRIWRSDQDMAQRGPLTPIRVDGLLGGQARIIGEAQDAAVTVAPAEDPEEQPCPTSPAP